MRPVQFGYHASHEQLPPGALLRHVQHAERAGFDAAMCSDHLQPWSEAQGQAGFAWSWLGAALATTSLSFGTVNAPGQRYHPVIVAQAAATLVEMFPERLWVAVGSGEALNEAVTGDPWPRKAERDARLRDSVELMRALFRGETVTCDGLVRARDARLWTRPAVPPALIGAAVTARTARWMGAWADGLITVAQGDGGTRAVADAFREGGGDGKPMYLQVHVSFGDDDPSSLRTAYEQWRTPVLDPAILPELTTPAAFEAAARHVRPEDVASSVRASSDSGRQAAWLAEDAELGFERIYVHEVGPDQTRFIERMAGEVLPSLRSAAVAGPMAAGS